jgi:hypothetical protein
MAARSYAQRRKRRIAVLERRKAFLESKMAHAEETGAETNDWDRAEASAIGWALREEARVHRIAPRDPLTGEVPLDAGSGAD